MKKILLDGILFALFVAELSFHHLPKILHEILGVAFTVAILIHLWINRRRIEPLTKKLSPRKIFALTIDFALTICTAVTVISGVVVSNYLFAELMNFELRRNITVHQLHVAAPYVMMILLGVHVGLHWRELQIRLLNFFGAEEFYQRHEKIFHAFFVLISIFGAAGLYLNRVGDRILMKHIFATTATELHGAIFALMISGGVILSALITFLLDKKIFSR